MNYLNHHSHSNMKEVFNNGFMYHTKQPMMYKLTPEQINAFDEIAHELTTSDKVISHLKVVHASELYDIAHICWGPLSRTLKYHYVDGEIVSLACTQYFTKLQLSVLRTIYDYLFGPKKK